MTTSRSPLRAIKQQADRVARVLKAADRGEYAGVDGEKMRASEARGFVRFALVMDDKTLVVEMAWAAIREASESAISAYLVKCMKEQREH